MQKHFEQFVRKQKRVELKYVGDFVAEAVLVESANHFSLEEVCRTQYTLEYFSKPYRQSDPLENLKEFEWLYFQYVIYCIFRLNDPVFHNQHFQITYTSLIYK